MAFYTDAQREMQERFGTQKLAQTVENAIVWDKIDENTQGFIESRDFFFLASVDEHGRPTVSYKGGPVGVVKVLNETALAFPMYDGNGMFKSVGNIAQTANVGLLFIDFETPNRVRVQGQATVQRDHPNQALWPGAIATVELQLEHCFLNCARYIHPHARKATSPYVPDAQGQQPHPSWKQIDFVQDALSEEDQNRTKSLGGTITMDGYVQRLMDGKS